MKLLAIETSGPAFSVALADEDAVRSETYFQAGLLHSEKLIPAIEWLLAQLRWSLRDLSALAVSTGPGSFTGIRVGMTCARILSQNLGLPLVGMDTLEILSAAVPPGEYAVYPALDALRAEMFVRGKGKEKVTILPVSALCSEFRKTGPKILVIGTAAAVYRSAFERALGKRAVFAPDLLNYPRAGFLAAAALHKKGQDFRKVLPLYVRRSWAEEKRKSPPQPGTFRA